MTPSNAQLSAIKSALFIACLAPAFLLWRGLELDTLGANPIEAITRSLGEWTLRLLLITLAVTPVRKLTGWHWIVRLRRMLGLYTFFYACCHFLAFAWLDMGFDLDAILKDIAKRPFILVGFVAFVFLTLLAATSFNRAIRSLGAARWQALHKLVYLVAVLAILHFFWMRAGKNDFAEVSVYGAILCVLLGWRLARFLRRKRQ